MDQLTSIENEMKGLAQRSANAMVEQHRNQLACEFQRGVLAACSALLETVEAIRQQPTREGLDETEGDEAK